MDIDYAKKITSHSQKLQDELQKMGLKIKHHEDNLKFLKVQTSKLDETILDMQVTLGKYHASNASGEERNSAQSFQSGHRTLDHIIQQDKSGAGVVCKMIVQCGSQSSKTPVIKDILGVVAMLGKVKDDNLSRLLSEYLGLDIMLAIVCKTRGGVRALEEYDKTGIINKSAGVHGLGTSFGKSLEGRFLVICLEDLRPYPGDYVADDPQKRLALPKPRLSNGESPAGFLGFAVNMIDLEDKHLSCITTHGHGLRETLFYSLLSRLQVYKSRYTMQLAIPYITDGAISLDGGMIKRPGIFSLGDRSDLEVKFPLSSSEPNMPQHILETEEQLRLTNWKKERLSEDMQREEALLNHEKNLFIIKRDELLKHLTESAQYLTQGHGAVGLNG